MVKFTATQAEKYRQLMNKAAVILDDDEAAMVPRLFEQWKPETAYEVGDRVQYDNKLWKVLIAHVSQVDWTPTDAPSLFAQVLIPDPSVIPEWIQPGSTNPYMKGDKVRHSDKVWISDIDNNVWEPGVYGWTEVVE